MCPPISPLIWERPGLSGQYDGVDIVRHLEYFLAVVDEGSFSRAAQALGMAQPPLSQRIKSLETHLGVELFDRTRRQIRTTAAGSLLVPEARSIVQSVRDLPVLLSSAAHGQSIAWVDLPPTIGLDTATQAAGRIADQIGRTVLPRLVSADERDVPSVDLHPRVQPGVGPHEVRLPLGLAVAPDHPLITGGVEPHPSDFADSVVLLLDEDSWQRDALLAWLSSCGVASSEVITDAEPQTAAAQVLLTGVCVVTDAHHARTTGLRWYGVVPVERVWHVSGDHAEDVAMVLAQVLGGRDA